MDVCYLTWRMAKKPGDNIITLAVDVCHLLPEFVLAM